MGLKMAILKSLFGKDEKPGTAVGRTITDLINSNDELKKFSPFVKSLDQGVASFMHAAVNSPEMPEQNLVDVLATFGKYNWEAVELLAFGYFDDWMEEDDCKFITAPGLEERFDEHVEQLFRDILDEVEYRVKGEVKFNDVG